MSRDSRGFTGWLRRWFASQPDGDADTESKSTWHNVPEEVNRYYGDEVTETEAPRHHTVEDREHQKSEARKFDD
jgi:hypothetical protein